MFLKSNTCVITRIVLFLSCTVERSLKRLLTANTTFSSKELKIYLFIVGQYENDLAVNCGQKCDQNKQLLASSTAAVSKATVPASGGSSSPYKVVPSHSKDDNAANERAERHLPITNRQQTTESHMQQQQSLVSPASAASPSAQQQQQVAITRSRSSQQHLNDARPLSQQYPSNGHLHHQQQLQQQQYVYGGAGNGRPSSVYGAYGVPVQMRTQQQHQQQRPPSVHGLLPASVTVLGGLQQQQQQRLTSASGQPTYDTHVSWRLSLSQSALQQSQSQGSSSGHVMQMHSQNSISGNHDSASNDGQQQQQQQRARKIIYEVVV